MDKRHRFALIGAAGYIAPRHLRAIKDTGNQLVAAVDPHDNVGIIDSYFPEARFFTEIERFDRHLEKLRRRSADEAVDYVSICSPNYLHDAHIRLALRIHAQAICEKPLVINPWNLEQLEEIEQEYGHPIHTVLQLRLHASVQALKQRVESTSPAAKPEIVLSYVTRRGAWYDVSWKGVMEKSGGVAMNIGIHFFDMLLWLFGGVEESRVYLRDARRMSGSIELERARVRWFLSVDENDLPPASVAAGRTAFRSLTIDGEEVDFSEGFTDLHTRVYEEILAGRGFGIADARPSIQTVYNIRHAELAPADENCHPMLTAR